MKKLLYSLLFISPFAIAQPTCPLYTSVGDASSPYILTSDPACAICDGAGATGPWTGAGCTGTIVSTALAPTLSLTLAYTAVNTDDYATISIDGGGVMTLTGDGVGVAGAVIGPYLCGGSYGDVFLTVESTMPFTTVTLVNTGCSSGWVIACPGGDAEAGADDLTTELCLGTVTLSDLLSPDASPGGVWTETTGSGAFDPGTTIFDADVAGPGVYTFEYEVTDCGATDIANFTITVLPAGTAGDDDLTTLVCNGIVALPTLLSPDAEPGGVWTETTGSGFFDPVTEEFDANSAPPGVYTFEYEIISCGVVDIANFTITVGLGGYAGEDNSAEICNAAGESLDLNTLLIGADPGGVWAETSGSGAFNPVTGVFTASGLPGGAYTFTYTFPIPPPCTDDVANFTVTVNPIPAISIATLPATGLICVGETMTLTATGAGVGGAYVWDHPISNGVGFTPPVGTDTYEVTATDANGCSNTATVDFEVLPVPNVVFEADTLFGCNPLSVQFTNLTLLPGISCLWQFGDGSSSASCGTVSHTYSTVGEFDVSLLVNSSAICSGTNTYNNYIAVKEQPEARFDYLPNPIDIEDTRVTFDNYSDYASEYEWSFGDGTATSTVFEPSHEFPESPNTTYPVRLIAKNNFGCADTIIKPITVEDVIIFYIPNVFTPDGDDFNEIFKPIMYSGIDVYNYHMTIYNKWGEIVFESYNTANGWNGTYGGGEIVQDGVYIWQIEFGDTRSDEIHKYTGHVTILK